MKMIYIVTSAGYRPAVAFQDEGRAELVRTMCSGEIKEVPVLDAAPDIRDLIELLGENEDMADGDEGGELDGV